MLETSTLSSTTRKRTSAPDHRASSETAGAVGIGAWWYRSCSYSSLNGPYLTSAQQTVKSIYWYDWKKAYIALKHEEMKIRPAM
nr:hypothetical protein BaRGS_001968 [Batillaria attramentaria]